MSSKQTIRYPEDVVEAVEDIDENYFSSKSEFYRFSAKYLLDEMGVKEITDREFMDTKQDIEEMLEKEEQELEDNPSEGVRAVNKIYSGYLLDDSGLLQEGTMELAKLDADTGISEYAEQGVDGILNQIKEHEELEE